MSDVQMRLGVLKQLRQFKNFIERMERDVKSRRRDAVYPAYVFLRVLTHHMMDGDLTPEAIELAQEVLHADYMRELREQEEQNENLLFR